MILRLSKVEGAQNCTNDVIYCRPLDQSGEAEQSTLVFFPGDVQNYPEVMEKYSGNAEFISWNLIKITERLSSKFNKSHIVVVKSSRMESNTYSCYDNFVKVQNKKGVPLHGNYSKAIPHLEALLRNLASSVNCQYKDEERIHEWKASNSRLSLAGFSKGCIVLNQIAYELCGCNKGMFLEDRLEGITWLDGGHSGHTDVWITQDNILKHLAQSGYRLRVEMTPYQLCNEESVFSDSLKCFGANITRRLHFEQEPPSLLNHFRLLDIFTAT